MKNFGAIVILIVAIIGFFYISTLPNSNKSGNDIHKTPVVTTTSTLMPKTQLIKTNTPVVTVKTEYVVKIGDNQEKIAFYRNNQEIVQPNYIKLSDRYKELNKLDRDLLNEKSIEYTDFAFEINNNSYLVELDKKGEFPDKIIFFFDDKPIVNPQEIWLIADSALSFSNIGELVGYVALDCGNGYEINSILELGVNIADWRKNGDSGTISYYDDRKTLYRGIGASNENENEAESFLSVINFPITNFYNECHKLHKISISAQHKSIRINVTAIMVVSEENKK